MTIDDAIRTNKEHEAKHEYDVTPKYRNALKLGIEALKVVNRYSFQQRAWEGKLLPGERKET